MKFSESLKSLLSKKVTKIFFVLVSVMFLSLLICKLQSTAPLENIWKTFAFTMTFAAVVIFLVIFAMAKLNQYFYEQSLEKMEREYQEYREDWNDAFEDDSFDEYFKPEDVLREGFVLHFLTEKLTRRIERQQKNKK